MFSFLSSYGFHILYKDKSVSKRVGDVATKPTGAGPG